LTVKEIVIAYDILRACVDLRTATAWREAIAGLVAKHTYTVDGHLEQGQSMHNYGIYACVGEWLRTVCGLADERAWIARCLAAEMPLFTAFGMYRDPGDPMLYDLSVRQNLSELLHYGYDGAFRKRIGELLRRGGLTTLLMISPCGYAPFGGRSNALLHNEAMVAYVCEFQAGRWRQAGRPRLAAAFKEAAWRAIRAVEPYVRRESIRCIKNLFDPATRHGKDSSYGEYANYMLLAASLFARTALVVDDTIPGLRTPPAGEGSWLHLWPAFHKCFATCGDTHIEIDTRCQVGYDATGLGRFHRQGAPPELALSMGIAADPRYVVYGADTDRAVAIGPCWKTCAGEWQSLAQMSREIEHVALTKPSALTNAVSWRLAWTFDSYHRIPVTSIQQRYRLRPGRLAITVTAQGVFTCLGLEVPCLITAGGKEAKLEVADQEAVVRYEGWTFRIRVANASQITVEKTMRANRSALYRVVRFEVCEGQLKASLSLCE
jgi:hypothetical protein